MAKKKGQGAGRSATDRVVEAAEAADLALVRFLYVDHGGIVRGKAVSRARLAERMAAGIGLTVAMQAMSMLDQLQPVDGMGPAGEVRLVPDPASGEDRLVPVDESLCFSTTGFGQAHDYAVELVRALEAQGLEVEQYYPELGHGQQELSIRHAPALRAADNQVAYRETVRGVAWRQGLWASLAPKPLPDQAGNGAHLHLSLWEAKPDGQPGGRNLLYDPDDRYGLSSLGYHFVAGVLAHLPALLALTCASVNSYRRLVPHSWSSAFTCYGPDNREAAVRIPSRLWGADEASCNLELKPSDATGNPYLALGAVIHAGLDGIRNKLDPGKPVEVDPGAMSTSTRRRRGIQRLPDSLPAALDALERDELLMEALGPPRRGAYLAVKRSEAAAFAAEDTAFECRHHLMKF